MLHKQTTPFKNLDDAYRIIMTSDSGNIQIIYLSKSSSSTV